MKQFIKIAYVFLAFVLLSACSEEGNSSNLDDIKYGKDFTLSIQSDIENPRGNVENNVAFFFIEINIEIARRKPRRCDPCECGLGVCRFDVCIPSCGKSSAKSISISLDRNKLLTGEINHLEMLLENDLPQGADNKFYVDEDILSVDDDGYVYLIESGIYELDKNLGTFGGYEIPIKITE